jgi:hypothetical protein
VDKKINFITFAKIKYFLESRTKHSEIKLPADFIQNVSRGIACDV